MIGHSLTLTSIVVLIGCVLVHVDGAMFNNTPRVRREWRTLSKDMRQKVADAMWIVKNTTTIEGRAKYGDKFVNYDEILFLHSCAVKDPRCDQGHYGPQFMTFHRAIILVYEESLLAVDPSIEAMPYWDYDSDTETGVYFKDEENYIFSDNFFGNYAGDPDQDGTVANGLFAYWPVAEYTVEKFGSKSAIDGMCAKNEYFKGTEASTCDRCCGKRWWECSCRFGGDSKRTTFLRDHDDCNPYVARDPYGGARFQGTYDLQGTQESFDACHTKSYIKEWMDWQNCIEFEQKTCIAQTGIGFPCINILPTWLQGYSRILDYFICGPCRLTGFYFNEQNEKVEVQALHSQAHVRFGKDLLDVTTSPNDVGPFMGYHANLDRNNMIWMVETKDTLESNAWGYPRSQDEYITKNRVHLSGPFAAYGTLVCGVVGGNEIYPDYNPDLAWFEGTLLNDTLNEGYPFTTIFDTPPANGIGYTHWEVIHYTSPERTPYTYDTLESFYYDL